MRSKELWQAYKIARNKSKVIVLVGNKVIQKTTLTYDAFCKLVS